MSQLNETRRSAPERPDHEDPWALQLVVHRVKANPARHADILAAAATAVVRLLDDARAQSEGPWAEAVRHWRAGWIRKVARRAENKRWDDVQQLPGVTVSLDTTPTTPPAEVRAMVPGPLAPLPPELKKLQVGGTEFPRGDASEAARSHDGAVVTVLMAPGVELSTGKAAAQAGHAAQLAYERLRAVAADQNGENSEAAAAASLLDAWRSDGFRVRVVDAADADGPGERLWALGDQPVRVIDAGLTEVNGPTETARAYWSAP